MCITEVWSYSECGCHYNHNITCRSFRQEKSPPFAPNIQFQYPMDRWLREATSVNAASNIVANAESAPAPKQGQRRGGETEPQECPQHSTVHKSFMNQICDDCLAEDRGQDDEVLSSPVACPLPSPVTSPVSVARPDEGVEYGEVNVVVDDMQFELVPNSRDPPNHNQSTNSNKDAEQRIFDSNVEITIEAEADTYSMSEEEAASSPLFPRSNDSAHSWSETTSPPSDHDAKFQSRGTRRYGLALPQGGKFDFSDADDEFENAVKLDWPPAELIRGRPLTRGNVNGFQRCDSGPEESNLPSRANGLARFKTLRSISDTLRPSTRAKEDTLRSISDTVRPSTRAKEDMSSGSDMSNNLTFTPARPNTLFRGLRSRKSSPLIAHSIEVNEFQLPKADHATKNITKSQPRKSSFRHWARAIIPDRKKSQRAEQSPSPVQIRSPAPSPTSSWTKNQTHEHDGNPILDSPSETAFDTESVVSSLEFAMAKTHIDDEQIEHPPSPTFGGVHTMVTVDVPQKACETELDDDNRTEGIRPTDEVAESELSALLPINKGSESLESLPEAVDGHSISNAQSKVDGGQEGVNDQVCPVAEPDQSNKESERKEILSPKSTLMRNIMESNVPRPHPPRKSSLRLPQAQATMTISDFEFPLPTRSRTLEGFGISHGDQRGNQEVNG